MDEETRVTQIVGLSAAPAASADACLVLIYPPGPSLGKRFELGETEVVIGRGHDCDILLDRDAVSRRHARIERLSGGGGWRVTDLESTNGSYVNDVPIRSHVLDDGDRLKIGNAIFKFLAGGNVESAYHEEIYKMTIIDGLTQAYNKRYFLEQLERELARCGRNRRPLSLLLFDIDHFKQINDTHGHLTGDHVLREMAARVRRRVRKDELFARYGGEEFAVVLPEATSEQALQIAETLRHMVEREPFEFEQERIAVTISLGAATVNEEVAVAAFIKVADECLYRAKRGGRNRVVPETMSELTPGPQPTAGTDPVDALDFDLWGCRGSRSLIPARSRIANFTSCYSLLHGDALLVMDAGRGLVRLGHQAMTEPRFARVRRVMMLVSHAHVDHWEGLKDADWFWQRGNDTALTVCGPEEALQSIRDGYAPPAYVSLETLATGTARSMEYAAIAAGADRRFAGFHIRAYGLHHYSGAGESKRMLQALGFRITAEGGATVCYLSDHEPTADTRALEQEITSGAHLVVHDANYPNITDHRFGHGSIEYAAAVARELPEARVLAAHHGSTLLDEHIEAAWREHGGGLTNFDLATEGASYRWDPAARRFTRR